MKHKAIKITIGLAFLALLVVTQVSADVPSILRLCKSSSILD